MPTNTAPPSRSARTRKAADASGARYKSGRPYLWTQDGTDIERSLRALHDLCWNAGFGWMMVGASGQLLKRSIVDRMVGPPEHLMFEGGPILGPLLGQDQESRRPIAVDGAALNTLALPPLTLVEKAMLRGLKAKERQRLAPE